MELSVEGDINLLSINQQVASVCAGRMSLDTESEVLAVGTQTNLLVYDINNNTDLFYNEVKYLLIV